MEVRAKFADSFSMHGLAMALVAVVLMPPSSAWSGAMHDERGSQEGPRWSNADHHERGATVGPDCTIPAPEFDARYKPGRDAWDRPVIPAGRPSALGTRLPLGVDIDIVLKDKFIGGHRLDMTAGHFTYDPATRELALNGHPLTQDCVPATK